MPETNLGAGIVGGDNLGELDHLDRFTQEAAAADVDLWGVRSYCLGRLNDRFLPGFTSTVFCVPMLAVELIDRSFAKEVPPSINAVIAVAGAVGLKFLFEGLGFKKLPKRVINKIKSKRDEVIAEHAGTIAYAGDPGRNKAMADILRDFPYASSRAKADISGIRYSCTEIDRFTSESGGTVIRLATELANEQNAQIA